MNSERQQAIPTNAEPLSTPQKRAIAALLAARSCKAAASSAGVSCRTLRRWLSEDAAFKCELHRRESEVLNAAGRDALKRTKDAVNVLYEVMQDKDEPGQVRLRAACAVLDYSLKFVDAMSTDARLSLLEGTSNA